MVAGVFVTHTSVEGVSVKYQSFEVICRPEWLPPVRPNVLVKTFCEKNVGMP